MKDHMQRLAQTVSIAQEIQNIKDDLEELPAKVRQLEGELEALDAQYQQKKAALEKAEGEVKRHKSDIEGDGATLKVKEERLHGIKTTKEYQAVLKEISTGKTSIKDREAAIVKLLGDAEALKTEVAPLESRRQELAAAVEQERGQIQGKLDELKQRLGGLETQLNEQLSSLPEDIRHKYIRIQAKRQPPAAKLVEGTCQECFMSVPPQLYIEIRKTFEIQSCPNCHRLLFLEF
ncbi:MAG TPA: C4-type zinc ribbon domain-containing protein [bacterium]|nr:C4-type zinc ribbon domain-containing protein [bacterium]